jgi:hypothetical protein
VGLLIAVSCELGMELSGELGRGCTKDALKNLALRHPPEMLDGHPSDYSIL